MKTSFTLALVLLTTGCSIRRPVEAVFIRPMKEVAKGMYCDVRDNQGKCLHWATHPYECVHLPDGSCTQETK